MGIELKHGRIFPNNKNFCRDKQRIRLLSFHQTIPFFFDFFLLEKVGKRIFLISLQYE